MFDIGFSELLVIGVVALVVIGPERLPKVARTLGHLMGRAQRYVNDVKSEINREMEIEELKKLQTQMQDAAREIETSVQTTIHSAESSVQDSVKKLEDDIAEMEKELKTAESSNEPSSELVKEPPAEMTGLGQPVDPPSAEYDTQAMEGANMPELLAGPPESTASVGESAATGHTAPVVDAATPTKSV